MSHVAPFLVFGRVNLSFVAPSLAPPHIDPPSQPTKASRVNAKDDEAEGNHPKAKDGQEADNAHQNERDAYAHANEATSGKAIGLASKPNERHNRPRD
jgi:hypothetical protein